MTILHFDCFSGAAGDMILGALLDAGLPLEDLRRALGTLAVDHDAVWTETVTRAGVRATKLHVRGETGAVAHHAHHGHDHDHGHGHAAVAAHAPHRTLAEIEHRIDHSALSIEARHRAKHLFERLAEAEAAVHGTSIDRVHLHEVGALDSIIDIVGAVYALEALGVKRVTASPLNVGGGMVHTAHGHYPVPGPATAWLLRDVPIYSSGQNAELLTPTGALLITGCAESFGPIPPMRLQRVGYGAGSKDFPDTPNVLRVLVGEADSAAAAQTIVVIETEIDDMNPQIFGVLIDRLMAAGALDVFYTPIQMKKNRPGTLLTIIAPPGRRDALTTLVFSESTTLGVRHTPMTRECLDRETLPVETPYGRVRMKVARRDGVILNASPEFDDCVRLATERGKPVKDVYAAAMKAFLDKCAST